MDKKNAINLLDETFNNDFNNENFFKFIKELFNEFTISKRDCTRYIPQEYLEYINSFEKIGDYKDSSGKEIEVLIVKLNKTSSRDRARTMQRNFISNWLGKTEKDASLVAFYGDDPQDWRFSFVKMEYNLVKDEKGKTKISKELTPAKRYSFLVGVNEPNHTCASQFVNLIVNEEKNPSLEEIEHAFSIEKVTKEFFDKYKGLFLDLKESLDKVIKRDKTVKEEFEEKGIDPVDFTKKLLGQIVFLYFLQKKGWLGVEVDGKWGEGPKDFMRRLFGDKRKLIKPLTPYKNFFNDILEPLFYDALANPREGEDGYHTYFKCKIPFLNGGLFEPLNGYQWEKTDILLDNKIFEDIFKTFDEFNFTVKEDEPLEKEVAVDPEMLGKVFENLLAVKDRKSKGAFYTPREIVHYMCQQSLINYLETNTSISKEDIEKFIQLGDFALDVIIKEQEQIKKYGRSYIEDKFTIPKSIKENHKEIDKLLKEIKVVDPAVGSGAFPVGMMNEIVKARSILSIYFKEDRKDYDLKREIIENCLYGVDIESSAVEITKLRFWLSLIVDELDMKNIKPLPNLDHKIICGNSLLEEFEGVKLFDEKLLGEVKRDNSVEIKQIDDEIAKLYKEKGKIITGKSNGDAKKVEKEIKKLEKNKQKLISGPKEKDTFMTLDEIMTKRIKESKKKLSELKRLQKQFFNEQNKKVKKQVREAIDRIERELIEETLKEEGNEEAIEKLEQIKKSKSKPFFLWKLYFSEVFQRENPGFDVVIANPPYVEFKNLNKKEKERLEKNYTTTKGKYDLYIPFLEKSQYIARTSGFIIYICPTRFMHRDYGKNMRIFIKNYYTIHEIIDFSDVQIFEGAINYTGIFSFENKQNKDYPFFVKKLSNLKGDINLTKLMYAKESSDFLSIIEKNEQELNEEAWYFHTTEVEKLLKKIVLNANKLSGISDGIYQGIATGKDGVFIVNKETINEYKLEKDFLYPLLKGKDVGKYKINWKNTFVIYPYDDNGNLINEDLIKQKAPNTYHYLTINKKNLSGRSYFDKSSKKWYELWNQRNLKRFKQIKIVTLDNAKKNSFCFDEKQFMSSTTVYSIILKHKTRENYLFTLGVLNSKLLDYYHKNNTIPQAGGFYRYQALFIEKLPIPKKINEKIVKLVSSIIMITKDEDYLNNQDKQVKVKRLEKEINEEVYKMYGINDKEVKLIESFDKND